MTEDTTCNSTQFDTGSVIDNKWVLIERIGKDGIALVLIAIGAMTIYHLVDNENSENARVETTQILNENINRAVFDIENLDSSLIAQDGREMKLVKRPNENHAFYADPSLVTFHHYVEFLNEVSESLTVNDGVVKHDEDIWIYLGDGSAQPGTKPIYIYYQEKK